MTRSRRPKPARRLWICFAGSRRLMSSKTVEADFTRLWSKPLNSDCRSASEDWADQPRDGETVGAKEAIDELESTALRASVPGFERSLDETGAEEVGVGAGAGDSLTKLHR